MNLTVFSFSVWIFSVFFGVFRSLLLGKTLCWKPRTTNFKKRKTENQKLKTRIPAVISEGLLSELLKLSKLLKLRKSPEEKTLDADAGTGTSADTLTRQQTWAPRSRGVSEQEFLLTLGQSSTLSVAMAAASSCASSQVPTSQSDIKSITSPTAALKRDLEGVEAQLRGLADRWARVEAELLRITCKEVLAQAAAPSTAWHLRR